jgi:cobalt-zinc-cadmium resistance protein CzcA
LNNTIESTQKATKLLIQNFPEIEKIVTKIGSAEIPTDPMPFESGDMMVILKDKSEWTSAKTFNELSLKMTKVLEAVPGITVGFQFPVQMRFNELMTGARQDVVCKIFGENLDSLTHYASRLNEIVKMTAEGMSESTELQFMNIEGKPVYLINLNNYQTIIIDTVNYWLDVAESQREDKTEAEMYDLRKQILMTFILKQLSFITSMIK